MNTPDAEGWIKHDGGPCPVAGDAIVAVHFRYGDFSTEAQACVWRHDWQWSYQTPSRDDIIGYRLAQPEPAAEKCATPPCARRLVMSEPIMELVTKYVNAMAKVPRNPRDTAIYWSDIEQAVAELRARAEQAEAEVLRLDTWADGMIDAALKERATGEHCQRELRQRSVDLEARELALMTKEATCLSQS